MKKKIAIILLLTIIMTSCMAMLCSCSNRKSREVEIEIVNPLSGELFEQDEILDLPTEQTTIEVRVKDKKSGKYLKDKNLSKTTVVESLNIKVSRLWKNDYKELLNTDGYLPIEEEGVVASNCYEIEVTFDCKPTNIEDEDYKRKYEVKTVSVCFYSNKDWRGTEYFELAFSEWAEMSDWGRITVEDMQDFFDGRYGDMTIEEFYLSRGKIWENIPNLIKEKLDSIEELNAFRSKTEYPFFNDEYADNKVNKALQKFDEFDENYFKEKSLIFIMQGWSMGWGDLTRMRVADNTLTISFVLPKGVMYPAVAAMRVSVIEVNKEMLKDVEQIIVEMINE